MSDGNFGDRDGAFFHIYSRGARKDLIFLDDDDRRLWLQVVTSSFDRRGCTIHAFCLMGNHSHMLVQSSGFLSAAMRDAISVYVRRFNRRHGFDGPLHRSRFGRKLVRTDSQFLTVSRYIHRNPLDMFDGPLNSYQWSSYRWLLDPASAPGWLETAFTLGLMEQDAERYRLFVEGENAGGPRETVSEATEHMPVILGDVVRAVAAAAQLPVGDLRGGSPGVRNPARLATCLLAHEQAISLSTVAHELGYGGGDSVRALVRRARSRLEQDLAFRRLVHGARAVLSHEVERRAA